jgi:hypothetical protein
MSSHGYWCTTPDGKWSVYVDVEHCLGETTKRIYINDARQKKPRRVTNDRVLLYDVDPTVVFFSRDGNWLFAINHGVKEVYHLPTGLECTRAGDRWVVTPGKRSHVTEVTEESVVWPVDKTQLWRLKDLLQPARE